MNALERLRLQGLRKPLNVVTKIKGIESNTSNTSKPNKPIPAKSKHVAASSKPAIAGKSKRGGKRQGAGGQRNSFRTCVIRIPAEIKPDVIKLIIKYHKSRPDYQG